MRLRMIGGFRAAALGLVAACFLSGCGQEVEVPDGAKLVPVTGAVQFGGEPLGDADIVFSPLEMTEGIGGATRTDAEGKFSDIRYHRGGFGLPVGKYRVAISKRVNPDGSAVPPNDETPPIESKAKELLPAAYSNAEQSKLEVVVEEGKPVEIMLE